MIRGLLENEMIQCSWPLYVQGMLVNGSRIEKLNTCSDKCRVNDSDVFHLKCEHGLSHLHKTINEQQVILSEVFIPDNSTHRKYIKNPKYKKNKSSIHTVSVFFSDLENKVKFINDSANQVAKKNFEQFHEVAKWAREIEYYSGELISDNDEFYDGAFDKASEDLKSLHKTSVMLMDSLNTSAIYFNPESAKFSQKKKTDLYGLVHKVARVLAHTKQNSRKKFDIKRIGHVANKHVVFESFKIIPLSLIQNAIKYRKTRDIEIVFNEVDDTLDISIVSYGNKILTEEIDKLFERGYRTPSARRMSVEGSGLGLYVLKIVADAHDFEISVTSKPSVGNKNIFKNVFTVSVH